MKVAVNTIRRQGQGVPKAISAPRGVEPLLTKEYEAVFKNTGKPMVVVEADMKISLVNAEFERLSGYTKEEIEGNKRWTEFVGRGDRKRMREYHLLHKSDPMLAPRCFEFRFVDRQGEVKNVVLTMGQIPGTNKSMGSLLDVTDRRREQEVQPKDSKELKERVKEQTAALAKANKALRAEITRRKRAEEALRESEGTYRAIFDSMLEGYFEVDLAGNFKFFNKAVSKFYGYSRDELMGLNYRQFTSPQEAQRLFQIFSEIYQTGNPHEIDDYKIIKKDGSIGIAEVSVSLLRNAAGEPIGFRGVTRDVTEKRKAKEALRESEARYRDILESLEDGYYETDLAGNYTFFNETVCKHHGRSREELMGMSYREHASPETAKKVNSVFSEIYRTGVPAKVVDNEVIRKDGATKLVEISASLLRNASGEPIGFRGISRDRTEQKKAEKALQQSEEKYRTILETMEEGYYELDLAGNFTFFNDSLCRALGYPSDELMGMNNREYTSPETAKKVYAIFNAVYKEGESTKVVDYEAIRKDGSTITLELSVSLMRDTKGQPVGFRGMVRDITERKKAEEALRQSEEKYRSILENITEGYFENDLSGNFTFVNNSLLEIYGYTRDELMGMHYQQYMDEENAQKVYQAYNKVYTTGEPDRGIQFEIIRKDGTKRYLENSIRLIKNADGQPVRFRGISRDITERKQIEETLRESEERYRSILDIIGDAYTENDLAGNTIFLNKESFKFLGYSEEEFVGMSYKDYTTPENAKKLFEIYNMVYRTGEPSRLAEYGLLAKDGTIKIVEATVELRRDKSGKPIGFRTLSRDITQRRQMEEALRQSEERYRTILESIEDGYYEVDLAGNFTFFNDSLCRIRGYTKDELMGMGNRDYMSPETSKKVYETFNAVYKTGEPAKIFDYESIRKDGSTINVESSVSLTRDSKGKPVGFRGVVRDITERKRAEERLQRYAVELERSNEEVKNFAYIVSHDLRVPLVNLKGYTSELRSALGVIGPHFDAALPHLDEEKRSEVAMALHEDVPEALEFISTSVSRMDSFINAVLVLSRLGRRELKPEPLDMEALVQQSLEILSHQIQEQGITVTVGSLPEVVADRTSMEQIVGNILGNAVKYLDPERPAQIKVTAKPNNTEQIFRIQDTGRGITKDDMHKVFAPFRRAGKQDTPGEGMGLAYVQTLVRRHGGRIWCESEAGKGTTFIFTIATPSGKGAHDA